MSDDVFRPRELVLIISEIPDKGTLGSPEYFRDMVAYVSERTLAATGINLCPDDLHRAIDTWQELVGFLGGQAIQYLTLAQLLAFLAVKAKEQGTEGREALLEAAATANHPLQMNPKRVDLPPDLLTDLRVRALLPDGTQGPCDIVQLDAPSLMAFLRAQGGSNPWAEDVVGMLFGYGPLHPRSPPSTDDAEEREATDESMAETETVD